MILPACDFENVAARVYARLEELRSRAAGQQERVDHVVNRDAVRNELEILVREVRGDVVEGRLEGSELEAGD